MNRLTAAEPAVFLGITPSAVRHIIRRAEPKVQPKGKRGKAHLYDPADVLRHAGTHDRRSA